MVVVLSTSISPFGASVTLNHGSALGAGPPVTLPSWSYRDPWQGQEKPVSEMPTMQPRWVQVVEMAARRLPSRAGEACRPV